MIGVRNELLKIYMGESIDNKPNEYSFDNDKRNLLILGDHATGKTILLRNVINHLIENKSKDELDLLLVSGVHNKEFESYNKYLFAPVNKGLYDIDYLKSILRYVKISIRKRKEICHDYLLFKPILLIIDDLSISIEDEMIKSDLNYILKNNSNTNVNVIFTSTSVNNIFKGALNSFGEVLLFNSENSNMNYLKKFFNFNSNQVLNLNRGEFVKLSDNSLNNNKFSIVDSYKPGVKNNKEITSARHYIISEVLASKLITDVRNELKMSVREFAELVDKPGSTISRIEFGSVNPSMGVLGEIASKLGKKIVLKFE